MKNIILCSSNPILIKSLYGTLRDEGHDVQTIEHPARAIQMVMSRAYDFLIIDSEPFGLSAEDAALIIKAVKPELPILFVGKVGERAGEIGTPVDLEGLKRTIQGISQTA